MRKLAILLVISFSLSYSLQAKKTTTTTTVLFETDKHQLTTESVNKLKHLIETIPTQLDFEITIAGHTDNQGDLKYNKKLSYNRAEEVKQFLINNGIKKNIVKVDYLGELAPIKPNRTDSDREANRRVEINLTTYYFDNIQELESVLESNKINTFLIEPKKENIITGKKGVKVLIKPETFTYADGTPINEEVKIELIEALGMNSFVSSGLLTASKKDLLESGGMIKLNATTVSGKQVSINANNPLRVVIPTDNRKDGMELFVSNQGDDWTPINQPISSNSFNISNNSFPKMNYNNIKLPEFVIDYKTKPQAPKKPRAVREPSAPKEESYFREIRWYQFLNKEKIKIRQKIWYEQAVNNYNYRMEKYDIKLSKYYTYMNTYTSDMIKYNEALDKWEEKIIKDREDFKKTDKYQIALKKYNEIYNRNLVKYEADVKQWKLLRKQRITEEAEDMEKLGITSVNLMNNYIFASVDLKWINVDRFYKVNPAQQQLLTLKCNALDDERVLVVFKRINSIISMDLDSLAQQYTKWGVPKTEPAAIFAYKVKNGKPMIFYRDLDGSNNYRLDYIPSSFSDIKELLSQFDTISAS